MSNVTILLRARDSASAIYRLPACIRHGCCEQFSQNPGHLHDRLQTESRLQIVIEEISTKDPKVGITCDSYRAPMSGRIKRNHYCLISM